MNSKVTYVPESGRKQLKFAGDILVVMLLLKVLLKGLFIYSNINQSEIRSLDIINEVESKQPNLDRGWYDTPFTKTGSNTTK